MTGGKRTGAWRIPAIWLIVGIPASAVVAGIVVLTLSITSYDGLVVDDYYRQGMGINRSIERTARAGELGISASIRPDREQNRLDIRLSSNPGYARPGEIAVSLRHATRSGFDHTVMAASLAEGAYRIHLPPLPPGKWHVELAADGWKINRILHW